MSYRHDVRDQGSSSGTNGLYQWYWEQYARDRLKWRWFINKAAAQFAANRICEAEQSAKNGKQ